ncbi:hypothetical protein MMSR116_29125 [Methylobacterium mesophilicum SR1.6/6]|uniref:Uncharacterized protein n=1 Tax=Methylobacterium mesophilicum SR1.6/6 TaxID=908290 RepID=A0A6B9FTZ0_9HYPH|nr:hypothetical protein [Methylobacterium mesophilicum]QGY05502.1 hypothetical protein MMSR116_29125 [Methylobacterium mesophilicum SR1.6/6]
MSSRRRLAWSNELSRIRSDRSTRPEVREERLRATRSSAVALSAWRGVSGRRYVVAVFTLDQAVSSDAPGAVFLAVRRGDDGLARIVGAGHRGAMWEALDWARSDRANELHLYQLAESDEERDRIVEDLVSDDAL